jgi:hypothetical protein
VGVEVHLFQSVAGQGVAMKTKSEGGQYALEILFRVQGSSVLFKRMPGS